MNKYEKEARVYPAIVGMIIPSILNTLYISTFMPDAICVWDSIIEKIEVFIPVALFYSALAYWIRQLFIDASKFYFSFLCLRKTKLKCQQQSFFSGQVTRESLKLR